MSKADLKSMLFLLLAMVALSRAVSSSQRSNENGKDKRNRQEDTDVIPGQDPEGIPSSSDSRRRNIVHKQSYAKTHHWGFARHRDANLCRFKRCFPGQKCVVMKGLAKCVCRVHCKPVNKPVCGNDGQFYMNPCEMHKAACLSTRDIYDSRNRDCFYKQSECNTDDFLAMQVNLLASVALDQPASPIETKPSTAPKRRQKRRAPHHRKKKSSTSVKPSSTPHPMDEALMPSIQATLDDSIDIADPFIAQDPLSALETMPAKFDDAPLLDDDVISNDVRVRSEVTFETTEQTALNPLPDSREPLNHDDIITSDARGDDVKRLFSSLDLDADGFVGSEEIHEVTLMEGLEKPAVISCTLYHLLHYADGNDDGSIDILELLSIYNVTVLHLDDDKRVLDVCSNNGERLTLQCDIQGEDNPVWRRYKYDLGLYGAEGITVDGSLVYFDSVGPSAAGNYTCHARNRPDIFQVIRLSVFFPPTAQVFPRTQHRLVGNSVTVTCHVGGVPPPRITWLVNGEGLEETDGRYIVMGNHTEIHINSAIVSDSAAYSCFASNEAGNSEEIAAVFIEEENDMSVIDSRTQGAYFAFHDTGFLIAIPRSCEVVRRVAATETVPGLLRQNKLCRASLTDGSRRCSWSSAVAVGTRFVYAAQPLENRIIVVDITLQRVAEVIATDPLPVSLHYVASTDQLFLLCWVDESRDRSTLQVIYAASVPGSHSAAQIQPLDGGNRADFSVFTFFVPQEGALNTESHHGFVAHKNEQTIYKMDLTTLLYDEDVIDLQVYGCFPDSFSYQPIGGRLHVTCITADNKTPQSLVIDYSNNMVVDVDRDIADYSREFVSRNARNLVRVFPHEQQLIVFNVSASGELCQDVVLHTNFAVADIAFEESSRSGNAATVYVSSTHQGDLMYLNAATGSVEIIDNLSQPSDVNLFSWTGNNRPLVTSSWYDRHIAVGGRHSIDIIDADDNDVVCRLSDVTGTSTIVWADGEN